MKITDGVFRAWDTIEEVMCEVGFIDFVNKRIQLAVVDNGICYAIYNRRFDEVVVDDCVSGEDKNGTMIYENDVIEYTYYDGEKERYIVTYTDDNYDGILLLSPVDKNGDAWNHYYGGWYTRDFCVIGNIHENPELMK
jgi:uncharacterized phage protein (TIGR01671 family)